MGNLTTLDGLEGTTSIGKDSSGYSIWLYGNPKLASATALSKAKGNFTSAELDISDNPELACVPEQWPAKDRYGDTIRNGKALHDPCRYQCDSTGYTCSVRSVGSTGS